MNYISGDFNTIRTNFIGEFRQSYKNYWSTTIQRISYFAIFAVVG